MICAKYHSVYMKCAVIVPVYKASLTEYEIKSFNQCCKILGLHHIYLVTYQDCGLYEYRKIAEKYNVSLKIELFSPHYFNTIQTYNQLMLSYKFYYRFKEYDYILVHQLDAYVFRDELTYWCDKNFDYIGAPWFTNYSSIEDGGTIWKTGNGGLSLRKISTMLRVFCDYYPLLSFKQLIVKQKRCVNNKIINLIVSLIMSIGYKNNISYFKNKYCENEDAFICEYIKDLGVVLNIPEPAVSMWFAFEKSPSYLYRITQQNLPFGCHAWQKYEYETFWKQFIN